MKTKKALVVGGGIIGMCSAYFLNKNGFEVTVIDKGDFQHGCSHGNAGMVVPSHFVPLAAPGMIRQGLKWMFNSKSPFHISFHLNRDIISWIWKFYLAANKKHVARSAPLLSWFNLASKLLYEEMAIEESLDFGLQKKGLLMHCKTRKVLSEEASLVATARGLGLQAEVLSRDEAEKLDPGVKLDTAGAVYYAMDAFLTPQLLMADLYKTLHSRGVSFVPFSQITSFSKKDNKIISVNAGNESFVADEYILATGSWSGELARQLSVNLPMMAGKGYSVLLPQPNACPNICSILTEARVAVTPMKTGLSFAGTLELGEVNDHVNKKRLSGIFHSIPQYFPEFKVADFEKLAVWTGLRPCSPDGLPYIGRPNNFKNLILATGHAMMGLSLGPATGYLVAQIAGNEEIERDISLLHPSRYD